MRRYRIQIDMLAPESDEAIDKRVVITCQSEWRIDRAISEWVREEIDTRAVIDSHAIADSTDGKCQECAAGRCDNCADEGIHAYPYWCACAKARHPVMPRRWRQNMRVTYADGTSADYYNVQFGVPVEDFTEYGDTVQSVTMFLATE